MLTRIIHFLGGWTWDDLARDKIQDDSAHRKEIERVKSDWNEDREYYQHELDKKNLEIQRLTDLILTEHGVIRPTQATSERKITEPIQRSQSWQSKKSDLEKKDRIEAQNLLNENAAKLAERWTNGGVQSVDEIAAEIESSLDRNNKAAGQTS